MSERRPEGRPPASKATTPQTGAGYTELPALGEQGELDIPAHALTPAEAELRFTVNRLAYQWERRHWWLDAVRSGRPCCPRCYRSEWAEAIA
jgi:hypothetical protein